MRKQKVQMVVLVAVLTLLIGGYFLLQQYNKKQAEKEEENKIHVAEIDADANKNIAHKTDKDTVTARSKYMADFYRCCNELCLSPQARAKLGVVAAKSKAQEKDPLLAALQDDDD